MKKFIVFMVLSMFGCTSETVYAPPQVNGQVLVKEGAAWSRLVALDDGSVGMVYQMSLPIEGLDAVNVSLEWVRSFDSGLTWSDPVLITERLSDGQPFGETPNGFRVFQQRNQALGQLPSGRLVCAWMEQDYDFSPGGDLLEQAPFTTLGDGRPYGYSFWTGGVYYAISDDMGQTWEPRGKINTDPFLEGNAAVSPHGPIVTLDDGTALLSVYGNLPEGRGSAVFRSTDNGDSWGDASFLMEGDHPAVFEETSLVVLNSGEILAHVRSAHGEGNSREGETDQYRSTDDGRTWSYEGVVTGINEIPTHVSKLRDGSLLMTWGQRHEPFGVGGKFSYDNGVTWGEPFTLIGDGSGENCGYANTVVTGNGSIILNYYDAPSKSDPISQSYKAVWGASKIYSVQIKLGTE